MIRESPRDVTSPMKMKFGFAVDRENKDENPEKSAHNAPPF